MVNTHSYVRGPLISNIPDIWYYRLYGQFFTGPNVDHISEIYCTFELHACDSDMGGPEIRNFCRRHMHMPPYAITDVAALSTRA